MPQKGRKGKGLRDLAKLLESKATSYEQQVSEAAKEVALVVVDHLAYHTPVDTSQALSSWIVTLGSPSGDTRLPFVPGMFGSTQHASAQATIADAIRVLKDKKPGQTIYIVNNQPYIRRLNEGTISRQPGGFVEAAVYLGKKKAEQFKFKG